MQPLSRALRDGTSTLHRRVERTAFMQTLLAGRLERQRYVLLLRSLQALYAALEGALAQHRAVPAVAAVHDPRLARRATIEQDLATLHGPGWADDLPVQPAALAAAEHLLSLGATQPALLVAHAYVRYLGDLSGGQLLQRIVARSYGLGDGPGTRFYAFAAPAGELAAALRDGLDHIADADADLDAIVAEAQAGFALHEQLFEELMQARDAGVTPAA